VRERERGIESLRKRVLEYSWEKWNGLYHWTIGTFLMDHSCVLVNGAMDYSWLYQWIIVMDYTCPYAQGLDAVRPELAMKKPFARLYSAASMLELQNGFFLLVSLAH
jgi:hypothetical protein